jgi:phenylacetate-CoA ligase
MHHLFETAYYKSPVWVQNLAVTALGYNLRKERAGREAGEFLYALTETERWPPSAMNDYVDAQLRAMVRHAFERVPYYRRLSEQTSLKAADIRSRDDLWKLPIIEKEQIRQTPRDFVADPQGPDSRLIKLSTSGTTGTPLTIFCDAASRRHHYAFWARLRGWFGVQPAMYRATFFGRVICPPEQQQPPFWRVDRFQRNYLFSSYHLYERNLGSYCEALKQLQPAEIIGYPSSLHALATYILDVGFTDIRPRVIFTTAETLLPYQRDAIERAFGTKVVDQYGSVEMVHFVSQCEKGTRHIHPEHGILEAVDEDGMPVQTGTAGEAVCTTFVNRSMPLLRYRLGDRVVLGDRSCECGRSFPTVAEVLGRVDDVLVTPSGRPLGRLNLIFNPISGLRATQIVQPALDRLVVKLVVDSTFSARHREQLLYEFRKRTGSDMRIELEVVPEIPREPNGKFRAVVSLLPPRQGEVRSANRAATVD